MPGRVVRVGDPQLALLGEVREALGDRALDAKRARLVPGLDDLARDVRDVGAQLSDEGEVLG